MKSFLSYKCAFSLLFVAFVAVFVSCDQIGEGERYIAVTPVDTAGADTTGGVVPIRRAVLVEEFSGQLCVNCPAASATSAICDADCGISFAMSRIPCRNSSSSVSVASTVFLTPAKALSKSIPVLTAYPAAPVNAVDTVPTATVIPFRPVFATLENFDSAFSAALLSNSVVIFMLPSLAISFTTLLVFISVFYIIPPSHVSLFERNVSCQ